MKNSILLLLAVATLFVACSRSGTPSPTADALAEAVAAHVATTTGQPLCGDDVCPDPGAVQRPAVKAALDSRTPAQIAAAACRRSDGSWACKGIPQPLMASSGNATAAQCGPACTVSSWYFDPQNTTTCASDANSCTSATCAGSGIGPCLTYQQIVTRLGSTQQVYPYGQSATWFELSPQTANTDVINGEYRMSGGGQQILDCRQAWVQAGAAFSSGAVSGGFGCAACTATSGGTPMQIAGMPGYVVANTLLNNTSKGSYAFVDSVGPPTVQQPQTVTSLVTTTALPSPMVDNDWIATDNIQPYTLPLTNLKKWSEVGADFTSGSVPTSSWVIGCRIYDPSGSAASAYIHANRAAGNVLAVDQIDGRLDITSEGGRLSQAYVDGCTGKGQLFSTSAAFYAVYGGGFGTGMQIGAAESAASNFQNNTIVHGTVTGALGWLLLQNVWSDGTWNINTPATVQVSGTFFGSYAVNITGGTFRNTSGAGTFATKALLTSGTLKLDSATTGTSYAAGVWTDGVNITQANLDTDNGLENPRTGSKFTNGT